MAIPGLKSVELNALADQVACPAFGHRRANRAGADPDDTAPIVLARGEGSFVFDVDGNRYVDFAAGFGSVLLGHGHAAITTALVAQASTLVQGLGDVYASDVKIELMRALARLHPGDAQVLLTQSGSDAVTAALKTATLATGRHAFVAFDGAYHGLGHGPLAACGFRASFREPFAPELNAHVRFCPYPGVRGASAEASLAMVAECLRDEPTAAVLVEPILGRGGCITPPEGFLTALCELAHREGALVIADEIWTGLGRTGSLLRCQVENAPIDILCLGKGLGGGLAISACIASKEAMRGWTRGETIHTSTHAGAPLACAAALATLSHLGQARLDERARQVGDRAVRRLQAELSATKSVVDVRGAGLMIGVELRSATEAGRVLRALLRRGFIVLTGGVDGATLTLTPALTIEEEHFSTLAPAIHEACAEP